MRDYQRRSKYILPRAVYHQVLWKIRDYYRLKEEAAALLELSAVSMDGMPKSSTQNPDKIGEVVSKREQLLHDVACIDRSLKAIPQEYRKGVWDNIQYGAAFPLDADRTTYSRRKSKFIYTVAHELGIAPEK